MYPKGTLVRVRITASGLQTAYPAANWLKGERTVRLLDDAPGEHTLDVLDVEAFDGDDNRSIYDFNILGPAAR